MGVSAYLLSPRHSRTLHQWCQRARRNGAIFGRDRRVPGNHSFGALAKSINTTPPPRGGASTAHGRGGRTALYSSFCILISSRDRSKRSSEEMFCRAGAVIAISLSNPRSSTLSRTPAASRNASGDGAPNTIDGGSPPIPSTPRLFATVGVSGASAIPLIRRSTGKLIPHPWSAIPICSASGMRTAGYSFL